MSLQGVLADFGLADVFQLIFQQRKSGTLEVTREGQVIAVDFFEGAVHAAAPASDRPDHALGEFLVQSGALSEPTLEQAFRQQARTLEPLRQVLDSSGQLSRTDFDEVEALLTRETLFGLFGWEDGSFRFRAQPRTAAPEARRGHAGPGGARDHGGGSSAAALCREPGGPDPGRMRDRDR